MCARSHTIARLILLAACLCLALTGCETRQTLGKSCTMYLYLCGSDLESRYGLAGANLEELVEATVADDVNIVVETGGSKAWYSYDIDPDKLQRYEVRDHNLVLVDEQDSASMGSADTLSDFLAWGSQNYPAERNMLVLWGHGGPSAEQICFDEKYNRDALDRKQLAAALEGANLPFKFELVVFDACYMAAVENAALLSDYADYLIASQEIMPSGGLDYNLLAQEFAYTQNEELGRTICDTFLQKCQRMDKGDLVELSLMDLSQTDELLAALDDLCAELAQIDEDEHGSQTLTGAAQYSAVYGTKSSANLIDLSRLLHATDYFPRDVAKDAVSEALDAFVAYRVIGSNTETAGASLYYPLNYHKDDLQAYLSTCPIDHYAELLKRIYGSHPSQTIELDDRGSISATGDFSVSLTNESFRYLSSVTYKLDRQDDKSTGFATLGTGCGYAYDTDTLTYTSEFDGTWPTYAGTPLYTTINELLPQAVSYASPICIDGEDYDILTVYKFEDDYLDGSYAQSYVWGGLDEYGIPSRDYYLLDPGDAVQVYAATDEDGKDFELLDPYVVPEGLSDKEATQTEGATLPDGTYRIRFQFTDIFGDVTSSDYALLQIKDGKVSVTEVEPA